MTAIYVGIDQSYLGFAVAAVHQDGSTALVRRLKAPGTGIDRLLTINGWLTDTLFDLQDMGSDSTTVKHVCMEGYAPGAKFGREMAGELGAIVKLSLLAVLGEPVGYPTIVAPTAVKKFVTGSGSTQKAGMLKEVLKKYGADFDDHNEADAYALARIALALNSEGGLLAYEREVLDKLDRNTEWTPRQE